ncbi:hypothetical protein Pint_33825 [Pistacia integerrima]|uniref:Uncharacterized protein n=1 Tax=Pistacia integerrima TaxID=434235 RepID=A0ACC0X5S9_9ROSI|nr:hypothetical protein Pint_33825 [Pistacia integerrima]KAJ0077530.1 hypothetical protein Patl1_35384 [Pistacia atlantica]
MLASSYDALQNPNYFPEEKLGDFNLNNFQDGVLSSTFMVGLLVASPIFASLAKR